MWIRTIAVEEGNALSIHALEWSRRGQPCVLLHGFGENASVWNHFAPRIASRFHVISVDLRGHGNSDWDPGANYNSHKFTADLTAVIASFGFKKTILIGHSWGAEAIIRFAAENPASVAGLVIIDFGPELAQTGVDEVLKGLKDTPRSFKSEEDYVRWLAHRRPLASSKLLEQFARYSLRQSTSGQYDIKTDQALATKSEFSQLIAKNGRYQLDYLWPILAKIKCSSLLVRGAASGVFPADVAMRMVDQGLPGSRLKNISAAGHAVMMDNPEDFSSSVVGFLTILPST